MDLMTLDRNIDKYCAENHISGVIRVTVRDEIKFEKAIGYADFDKKIPFAEDSMFTLYSLSKPFCAIGLLILYDRGIVNLDAHPSKYVPEAEGFDGRVTIRQMLHHVSGIPDFEQDPEFAEKHAPGYAGMIRSHLKELSKLPMRFEPGTGAMYANVNFVLSALIIENASGMPYAEYMRKEVFDPLGMKNAVVDDENKEIPNRVTGYEICGDRLVPRGRSYNWVLGAGDIVGTVDDVYCLNKAIKNRELLSDGTWSAALTPSRLNGMGMGCTISDWHGRYRITHNGGHLGFRTLHVQLPGDDFDIIFLSNSGFGNARNDIAEMIYDSFYGGGTDSGSGTEMDKGYI